MGSNKLPDKKRFQSLDELRAYLNAEYWQYKSWRKFADKEFTTVAPGTLCRIAKHDYDPRSPAIRAALRLPRLITVPACECGSVHTTKRCPLSRKRKPARPRKGPTPVQRKALKVLGALWE